MNNPEKDYENVANHILRFEKLTEEGKPSNAAIKRYQILLDGISSHYQYDNSVGYLYAVFYELQALILLAKGDNATALKFMNEAVDVKQPEQHLVSTTGQVWDSRRQQRPTVQASEERYRSAIGKKRFSKRTKVIFWSTIGAIVLLTIASGPISDYFTIQDANPTMLKLAHDAGMTRQGELIFLRTNPQLVNDTQLAQVCPDAQSNNNGFIEQGCYVPNQSDPTTGRIYIRQMSSDLSNLEVTTAAYEMLHPAYIGLTEQSDGAALNKSIESNLATLTNDDLQAQIANFAKTEPGAKDLELFSILGTEYGGISSDLAAYYAPYITDLSIDVSFNNQINQLFQNETSQLTQLQDTINKTDADANTAYSNSVSWANAGDQYEDDYNYNIYKQDIALENSYIEQYNQLLGQYNVLVDEYNGQQFNPDNQVQIK